MKNERKKFKRRFLLQLTLQSIPKQYGSISQIQHNSNRNPNTMIPTTNPAYNLPYNPLKAQNMVISTGNEGVPTDRQTDQQTDQQTDKGSYNQMNNL